MKSIFVRFLLAAWVSFLPIEHFSDIPNKDKLKFALAPISYFDKPTTRASWRDHLVPYMIEHYLKTIVEILRGVYAEPVEGLRKTCLL